MFRGSCAPWGRSEDRGEGAGSEADGARPPVKPGHRMPVLGGFGFYGRICFGEAPSSGLRIDKARRSPVLPGAPFAFRCAGDAQLRALDTSTAWRREGPERTERLFIRSLLRLAFPLRRGASAPLVSSGAPAHIVLQLCRPERWGYQQTEGSALRRLLLVRHPVSARRGRGAAGDARAGTVCVTNTPSPSSFESDPVTTAGAHSYLPERPHLKTGYDCRAQQDSYRYQVITPARSLPVVPFCWAAGR